MQRTETLVSCKRPKLWCHASRWQEAVQEAAEGKEQAGQPPCQVLQPAKLSCSAQCPALGCSLALLQASSEHLWRQQQIIEQMELRRKMRTMVVPTDDNTVRGLLRQMGEPITLFGEREVRRQRGCFVILFLFSTLSHDQ